MEDGQAKSVVAHPGNVNLKKEKDKQKSRTRVKLEGRLGDVTPGSSLIFGAPKKKNFAICSR